jgi:hypothetical protein
MALEVVVDAAHRAHAGVVGAGVRCLVPGAAGRLLGPVVDAADEGRDQRDAGVAAGQRLAEGEQQREVAVDALALQFGRGLDALPGRGDLDQHAIATHALALVERHQAARARQRGGLVEGQARVDLGADATGDVFEDLESEAHQHTVHHLVHRRTSMGLDHLGQQRRVVRLLHGLEDQRGIGGGIARRELRQLQEVAGVGDDDGVGLELLELVHGGSGWRRAGIVLR